MALVTPDQLREEFLAVPGFVQADKVHSEFADGDHGQKLDAGVILPGMPEYEDWIDTTANHIAENCDPVPTALMSVANGTSFVIFDVIEKLQSRKPPINLLPLVTRKEEKKVFLTQNTIKLIDENQPDVLIFDDIGTRGSTTAKLALEALKLGAKRVRVLYTMLRRQNLERLDKHEIGYDSVIPGDVEEQFPTYTPNDCKKIGLCLERWELLGHGE